MERRDVRVGGLPARLRSHIGREALFAEPGEALVAVSGGTDSVALLALMRCLAPELALTVVAAHVDHGIHPQSSEWADAVERLAARWHVSFVMRRLALGRSASETTARSARYAALREMQRERGARYLVTAHHRDDQIETVLLRMLRGSGAAGLAGIPAQGPGGLVRPLLAFGRAELCAWLHDRDPDVVPVEDPANRDPRHDRSWMRTELLPVLRTRLGARLETRLLEVAAHARESRRAWGALLRTLPGLETTIEEGRFEVARGPLAGYDKMLSVELLRAAAREVGCQLSARHAARLVAFLDAASGRTLEVGGGWIAETVFDRLVVRRIAREARAPDEVVWGTTTVGEVRFGEWIVSWRPAVAEEVIRGAMTTWLTPGAGAVRGPRAGDRMVPFGASGHRPIRRLLMEARVPRAARARSPVVTRDDEPVWMPGVCRSATAVPALGTHATRLDARRG